MWTSDVYGTSPASHEPILHRHTFDLPRDVRCIALRAHFTGTPRLMVRLRDPRRTLRAQGFLRPDGQLSVHDDPTAPVAPGSVPGALPPGPWQLEVFVPLFSAVAESPAYHYHLQLTADPRCTEEDTAEDRRPVLWAGDPDVSPVAQSRYPWQAVRRPGERWYRGDLHAHTLLSDGRLTATGLCAVASRQGLDFFAITEHNIATTAWVDTDLLVLPGIEYTSRRGHWNALGLPIVPDLFPDERDLLADAAGIEELLLLTRAQGALSSLNHPFLEPWHWRWQDVPLGLFDCLEIMNDPTYPGNERATEEALGLWDRLWARGLTLTGVGGSDTHLLPSESHTPGGPPALIGDPATVVRAEALSPSAILAAIRRRRVYVTRGPDLTFHITAAGDDLQPGDIVGQGLAAATLSYEVSVRGAPVGSSLAWLQDGAVVQRRAIEGEGPYRFLAHPEDDGWHWWRLEVRDGGGRLLAFVNPVGTCPPTPPTISWRDVAS